ncbi:MAG: hypothetical protein B1H04_05945 [Planctomycetales bacterium 4484_123]|nr:MAG: hypothetical protein B1H04_05945 [Planctomycetales bacterium 4484_123]
MKVLFCGSGRCGLPTLRRLADAGHEVVGAVSQPPRRAGRGGRLRPTPVAELAGELGLEVMAVEDINDPRVVRDMAAAGADVTVVVDFGQKLGLPARSAARLGAFNMHASLLPALRGAAPINWAIIRGCERTGVTTFRMVDAMDAGEIFSQRETEIGPEETAEELETRLAELGVETVLETLEKLAAGELQGRPQDHSRATRAPRLRKSDGRIDFAADAVSIRNLIHGTWPWPGAQAKYISPEGRAVDVILGRARSLAGGHSLAQPGTVLDDLTVATGQGRLAILEIKPANRRLIGWRDFVNGYRVRPGTRFVSTAP